MTRTREQLLNHYQVEKELADKLRKAHPLERPALYGSLYDELFRRVPDHPRLTRRDTEQESRRAVTARLGFLKGLLNKDTVFLEIAPGDCRLAFAVAEQVAKVYAVDISDQSGGAQRPANFELVVYDGCRLDFPEKTADVAFSYQFIEHLHPEDMPGHFAMVHRLLKPGGVYVFDTPHRYSGPHDISREFSTIPEGFHLKEWTNRELMLVAQQAGFSHAKPGLLKLARLGGALWAPYLMAERCLEFVPHRLRRKLCRRLFASVALRCYRSK